MSVHESPIAARESYFISTPYVDAYDHDCEPEQPKIDFATFVHKMTSQAYGWGEHGVGRALLIGLEPAVHEGRYVLAFGSFGDKNYVAVPAEAGKWEIKVVEIAAIPTEWDAT